MPPTTPGLDATVSYSRQYRRCGKPDCPACRPGLPGHGPYWYARWQEGGRTRSRYIGRGAPPGAATAPALRTPVTPVSIEEGGAAERDDSRTPAFPDTDNVLACLAEGVGARDAPSRMRPTPTTATTPRALRVRTLGAFTVWRGDELIEQGRWSRRTAAALFKCLLSVPGHRLSREQAVDALWPNADGDRGDTNLRATVHRLRAVLDEPGATTSYLRSDGLIPVLP